MKTATSSKGKSRFHYDWPEAKRFNPGVGNRTIAVPMDPEKRWPGMHSRLVIEGDQLYLGNPDPADELYVMAYPVTLEQVISWLRAGNAIERTGGEVEIELLAWVAARLGGR